MLFQSSARSRLTGGWTVKYRLQSAYFKVQTIVSIGRTATASGSGGDVGLLVKLADAKKRNPLGKTQSVCTTRKNRVGFRAKNCYFRLCPKRVFRSRK